MADGDLGLFPPAATGRYTARKGADPWTRVDRLLLYPVLAACGSEFAYLETAVWLCEFLNRPPVFPAGYRPRRLDVQLAAVKTLERKTVTEGLAVSELFESLAARAYNGRRTGLPLTWTELRLVRSYHAKRTGTGGAALAVGRGSFLTFLNRGQADGPQLAALLDQLARGEPQDDPPEDRGANPSAAAVDINLAKALTRVRTIGEESGSEFPAAWAGLYDVLGGLTSSTLR